MTFFYVELELQTDVVVQPCFVMTNGLCRETAVKQHMPALTQRDGTAAAERNTLYG